MESWMKRSLQSFYKGDNMSIFVKVLTKSMLTFKLVSCCRLRDATVMTNKQHPNSVLIPLMSRKKSVKVHLRFPEKPAAHANNCRCDAWKCDIMLQIKVNPSKATCFFHSYSLWTVSRLLARRHTNPAAIGCLSSMYPSNRSSSPSPALCLQA